MKILKCKCGLLPNSGRCKVYVKSRKVEYNPYFCRVVNCYINWGNNLQVYIEVLE